MRNAYESLVSRSERNRPLGRHTGRLWIILKWVVKKQGVCGQQSAHSGQGPIMGSCEPCYKLPVYKNGEEFLDQQNDYQLLKKNSLNIKIA
jgi:hypothetical protein